MRERFSTVYSTPLPPNSLSNQELSVVHTYDSIITYKTVSRKFSQAPDLGFSSDFYFPLILIEQLYGSAFGYARVDILLGNKVTTYCKLNYHFYNVFVSPKAIQATFFINFPI